MDDPAVPNERPPYLDSCGQMGVDELYAFISDSLEKRPRYGSNPDLPYSQEEFWSLWELLRDKARAQMVPPVPLLYEESDRLKAKRAKLERLHARLRYAHGDPAVSRRDLHQMQDRLPELENEIVELLARERKDHAKRHAAYDRDRSSNMRLRRIVTDVRKAIENAFGLRTLEPTGRLQWRNLPPGQASLQNVRGLYAGRQCRGGARGYDETRLTRAFELSPNGCHVGIDGFDGYIVFTFPYTSSVLMECPIVGNAIYVIHKDWERWSKMTKQELMADESGEVTRIEHRGDDWVEQVKQELESPSTDK